MDFTEVAEQAEGWSRDPYLPEHLRRIAGHLARLAVILTDKRYGCSSEYAAAEMMYRILCDAVQPEESPCLALFVPVRERRKVPRYLLADRTAVNAAHRHNQPSR